MMTEKINGARAWVISGHGRRQKSMSALSPIADIKADEIDVR